MNIPLRLTNPIVNNFSVVLAELRAELYSKDAKIEELHNYIISQKKFIDEQKMLLKKVNDQNKQLREKITLPLIKVNS